MNLYLSTIGRWRKRRDLSEQPRPPPDGQGGRERERRRRHGRQEQRGVVRVEAERDRRAGPAPHQREQAPLRAGRQGLHQHGPL